MTLIANIIGVIAVVFFVLSYQQKTRGAIILCNIISRALYVVQYLVLGALEGAVLDILGMIVSIAAQKKELPFIKKHLKSVVICANLSIVAVGLFMYESPLSLFPMLGVLLHTGAFWLTDERKIRIMSFIGSPFWFIYNFASKAYGSSIGDAMTLVSIAVAIVRYDILKKTEKIKTSQE